MSQSTIRNLIIAGVLFLIIAAAVGIGFWQVLNNSQNLEQQIAVLAEKNAEEAELLRLERIAQNSEAERTELASYFLLRESDSIRFLTEIETLAPAIGVALETSGLQQVPEEGKTWIQAQFSISGTKAENQRFIEVLESMPYVSRIKSINLQRSTSGDWSSDIIIQVQLLTYD